MTSLLWKPAVPKGFEQLPVRSGERENAHSGRDGTTATLSAYGVKEARIILDRDTGN